MTHESMPAVDLFAQLEALSQTIARTDDTDDAPTRIYEIERRELVDRLAKLDQQHADRIAASQQRFDARVNDLRKLVVANRDQLFPGDSRVKKLGGITLSLRTQYFVRPDSKHTDDDMRLVTRANNPAGITPRGMASLMKKVAESLGVGKTELLVVSFNDSDRSDHVVRLSSD